MNMSAFAQIRESDSRANTYPSSILRNYFSLLADLVVEGKVLVELKAERELHVRHEAQVLNYLKATQIKVGLLVNFGDRKCEWKRLVM